MEGVLMEDQSLESKLDELIIANRKLEALLLLRQERGLSIPEALDAFTARYKQLRAEAPDRFTCDDKKYWEGFYS
jgi:hypothetical protein